MEPGKNEMYNGPTLAKLHGLQLKIAMEIQRVCEKNGLRCFLVYGSLLGAVRHGGFIPWDDDMDVGMLRADYDAFVEACKTDLGSEFVLQTWDNDPEYPFADGKVRLKGTHVSEKFAAGCGTPGNDGICVDVFPFNAVPDGTWARKLQGWGCFVFKRLLWIRKGFGKCIREESFAQRLKYDAFRILASLFPYGTLKKCFRRVMGHWNGRKTRDVVANGDYYLLKQVIPRAWTEDLEPVPFEGETFPAFRERVAYLERVYGDYMALPPPEKRRAHELGHIDFGPYGGQEPL